MPRQYRYSRKYHCWQYLAFVPALQAFGYGDSDGNEWFALITEMDFHRFDRETLLRPVLPAASSSSHLLRAVNTSGSASRHPDS